MSIGIICEYSPFHNGHLYHIKKIKEMYPESKIILVMSSNFLQRGDVSILNKWDKTEIALKYGVDIVIELPFVFSSQSADIFARGAIEILKNMNVDKLVFGSELNDIEKLKKCASIQSTKKFNDEVKKYLDEGINYPTALSKVLDSMLGFSIKNPNDLLAVSYIKEIIRQKTNIEPICIKRTNSFHDKKLSSDITSATSIRLALKEKKNIKKYVPTLTYKKLKKEKHFIDDYYDYLKYKIISDNDLSKYQTVDEGIESRIKKYINSSNTFEELVNNIKTKRYTYNKISRMLIHILCSFTKEEAKNLKSEYIRILGFNEKGKKYLNSIKKNTKLPIITGYSNINSKILDIENRVNNIYALNNNDLIKRELKEPIKL